MNFADMTNQLPMLSAKNPSLMRGGQGWLLWSFICIIDLSHSLPHTPQSLPISTLYPTKIFGGKHGSSFRKT